MIGADRCELVAVAHLFGDGTVGRRGEVEPLEVLAFAAVAAVAVERPFRHRRQRQGRDERAAHGAERLHLRQVQPVRVPLAPAPPQQRVSPPPAPCRRLRLLLRRHYQLLLAGVCGDLSCGLPCGNVCWLTRVRRYIWIGGTRLIFTATRQ